MRSKNKSNEDLNCEQVICCRYPSKLFQFHPMYVKDVDREQKHIRVKL